MAKKSKKSGSIKRQLILGTGAVVAVGAFAYGYNLYRISNAVRFVINTRIYKVSLTNLSISNDVKIINPTNSRVVFRKPTVYLDYPYTDANGKQTTYELGYSDPSQDLITIEPNSVAMLNDIRIEVQMLSLAGTLKDILLKVLSGSRELKLNVKILTQINGFQVNHNELVTLNVPTFGLFGHQMSNISNRNALAQLGSILPQLQLPENIKPCGCHQ